jgi:hypothetical protein
VVPEALPTVTQALLELGTCWGVTQLRRLRPALLLELVAAVTGDDDGDRRLAETDLTDHADARYFAEVDADRIGAA